ncbi:MAG: crotonase/enoyl-CoA hydratase family protein [Acidimicrobiia bacterium]|nr:crotonase/enoyl-CoA hydratase family protein [Acidimicrobiia bacterium]
MADELLTETRGRVRVLTLNRPDVRNAVNTALANELAAALEALDADDAISVGVLTGSGRGFCAGMDLKAFLTDGMPTVKGRGFAGITEYACDKPLVAAIEGFALAGGLEVALSCDLLVAAAGARMGIPETGVGLFAAGGALLRLPRRVPYGIAMELALTADPITAEQAAEWGLVNRVTEPGQALTVAIELAERIARNAPLALAASKKALLSTQGRTEAEFWQTQRDLMGVFDTEDAKEGARAFAEKRDPDWQGR